MLTFRGDKCSRITQVKAFTIYLTYWDQKEWYAAVALDDEDNDLTEFLRVNYKNTECTYEQFLTLAETMEELEGFQQL